MTDPIDVLPIDDRSWTITRGDTLLGYVDYSPRGFEPPYRATDATSGHVSRHYSHGAAVEAIAGELPREI